ncbi:G2/mitotic-specific cyclin-A [Dirofilaria immitis]|nr:G2/mitotic-specific cyclin-A [Dirofilaria immitis]
MTNFTTKGQRKCRPHALAYRDTNISGSNANELLQEKSIYVSIPRKSLLDKRRHEIFQQRNQELSTRNRWLPTGTSSFTVFCDNDDQEAGSSKDFKENREQEGNKEDGKFSMQNLQVPKKIRRPLATLSPNYEGSDSENSRRSLSNLLSSRGESNSGIAYYLILISELMRSEAANIIMVVEIFIALFADENDHYSKDSIASSADNRNIFDIYVNQSHSDDEVAPNVDSVYDDIQEMSRIVPNTSSQAMATTTSSSIIYTIEEHQDRVRMDPVYDTDIYAYMRYRELKLYPFGDFLEFQEEICGEIRYLLVEWICDSAWEFNLSTESLHMAVSIVDRVLNVIQCPRQSLQLLGAVALLLASKFEEIYPPSMKEFARITAYTFHETEIIRMERIVFARLEYQLLAPTSWWFASRLIRMARVPRIIYYMMRYLLELALLDHTFLDFRPSVIGAASFFLSNVIFKSDYLLWITETDIGLDELRLPARKMLELFHEVPNKNYCSVFEKYAAEKYEQQDIENRLVFYRHQGDKTIS